MRAIERSGYSVADIASWDRTYPADAQNTDDLIKHGDQAMYVGQAGRGQTRSPWPSPSRADGRHRAGLTVAAPNAARR